MSSLKLIAIGVGDRGNKYGDYVLESGAAEYVGVADLNPERRARFAQKHHIPAANQVDHWEDLLSRPKFADAVVIATPDRLHFSPTIQALSQQYHVLLEKPMANTLEDTLGIVKAWENSGTILQVAHVLRYTDHFNALYEVIASERLGKIITLQHEENVATWHMAHSFVRGNWRRKDESAPMILAKCCHDLDLLVWFLNEDIVRLSSVGSLQHFKADHAPYPEVPLRCTDGCMAEHECPFFAPDLYIHHRPWNQLALEMGLSPDADPLTYKATYLSHLVEGTPTPEKVYAALQTTNYGRCVYQMDNDVVDHQVVLMQSESGIPVTLTMHGFSSRPSRITRINGTKASLVATFAAKNSIIISDHKTGEQEVITQTKTPGLHGGGDGKLVQNFLEMLAKGEQSPLTSPQIAAKSHILAFAAEEARLTQTEINPSQLNSSGML